MTVTQLAKRLGVDRTTVYRWIEAGRVHPHRSAVSGRLRFSAAEVKRIVREEGLPGGGEL